MTDSPQSSRKFQKELNAGTSALVLLSLLSRSREPMYGYQIAKLISQQDSPAATLKQGALYPVLRSLEANGLLTSTVEPSISGPPRKYYKITANGRAALRAWSRIWFETRQFVDAILRGE